MIRYEMPTAYPMICISRARRWGHVGYGSPRCTDELAGASVAHGILTIQTSRRSNILIKTLCFCCLCSRKYHPLRVRVGKVLGAVWLSMARLFSH